MLDLSIGFSCRRRGLRGKALNSVMCYLNSEIPVHCIQLEKEGEEEDQDDCLPNS